PALEVLTQIAVRPCDAGASGVHQGSRYGELEGVSHLLTSPLIVGEEEDLVPLDRAANCSPEDVGERIGNIGADRVVPRILGEWVACLLGIAAAVIISRAVKFIRARFRLHDGYTRHGGAELSVVVLVDELQFLYRIERWVHHDLADEPVLVVGTVQHKAGRKGRLAV